MIILQGISLLMMTCCAQGRHPRQNLSTRDKLPYKVVGNDLLKNTVLTVTHENDLSVKLNSDHGASFVSNGTTETPRRKLHLPLSVNRGHSLPSVSSSSVITGPEHDRSSLINRDHNLSFATNGNSLTVTGTTDKLNLTRVGSRLPGMTSLTVRARVSSLTGHVTDLAQLRSFDLSGNRLTSLPAQLRQLTQLRRLNVSNNDVTGVLKWLRPLLLRLDTVDLSGNRLRCTAELDWLTVLPSLYQPEKLTCVGSRPGPFDLNNRKPLLDLLRAMKLVRKTCPGSCSCQLVNLVPRQVRVDCSGRQLRQLPEQLPVGTVALNVSANQISRLSPRLCRLLRHNGNFTAVDLSRNRLAAVGSASWRCAAQLGHLDLRHNRLRAVRPAVVRAALAANLSALYLSHNPWYCGRRQQALQLKRFLLDHIANVADIREVRCSNDTDDVTANKQVYRLPDDGPVWPRAAVDLVSVVLTTEVAILLTLAAVFVRDVRRYRRSARLPWIITCCGDQR